jgi:uncharacterized protein YbbC (DUF1343 family)
LPNTTEITNKPIIVGAANFQKYIHLLRDKRLGVVANQGSVLVNSKGDLTHLIDTLIELKINIKKVFSPEHGFRGTADAGEIINDENDAKTGLPIVSLYGKNIKPTEKQLEEIDVLLFDLQDVGVRFYTYISTLYYIMQAASENDIPVIVLDRPNPNAHYIDGPVLNKKHKSFVGMHPVPVVYGMTIGEYAQMIKGENWLETNKVCQLNVIPIQNYNHRFKYNLPVKPSPNLPNAKAINLYPSLCFFEGANISCGRGTDLQFQIFGAPELPHSMYQYTFTPKPNAGAKNPVFQDKMCFGLDLTQNEYLDHLNLKWLIEAYKNYPEKELFFNDFFNKLAGNEMLKNQIIKGVSVKEIRKSWQKDLDEFKIIRSKYLLYP